ncbi:MAG: RimK/LysX family protein [Thermoguttaceae bacterium]|jgi:hypothetical protein
MPRSKRVEPLPTIGWREWISLPGLGIPAIKAKVDTGACSSSVHAFDVSVVEDHGRPIVRFKLHPYQRDFHRTITAEAVLIEFRRVRSSGGHETLRPVVLTEVELLGQRWSIELTLASRDTMGFRMLLGRQAVRHRFVVDPGRSFLGGRRKRKR